MNAHPSTQHRSVFDATREVGARADPKPMRATCRCVAHGCPMPGSIFTSGADEGVCAWHYGEPPHRWPVITEVLTGPWGCVARHINAARRVLANPDTCLDHETHRAALGDGLRELSFLAPGWGLEPLADEDLGDWASRLTLFLCGCMQPNAHPVAQLDPYARGNPDPAPTPAKQWASNLVARAAAGGLVGARALAMAREVVASTGRAPALD